MSFLSAQSVPSKPVTVVDIPEVKSLNAIAHYNFFTPDEAVDESGSEAVNGNVAKSMRDKGTVSLTNIRARVPRLVELKFSVSDTPSEQQTPGLYVNTAQTGMAAATSKDEILQALIEGKVYTEEAAMGSGFSNFLFGNDEIRKELSRFWTRKFLPLQRDSVEGMARQYYQSNGITHRSQPPKHAVEALIDPSYGCESQDPDFIKWESKFYQGALLNNSYAPYMLRREMVKGLGPYHIASMRRFVTSLKSWREDNENQLVSDLEYVFDMPMSNVYEVDSWLSVDPESAIVGYLFEKERIFYGKAYKMPPIYCHGGTSRSAFDTQVAYGQTYRYCARAIAKVRIPLTDWTTGKNYVGEWFLASKRSAPITAKIVEDRRPEPPQSFTFMYDYDNDNLNIVWEASHNPQRDIKYLQVFRRKTTDQPFELLAHYDFDDSILINQPRESITAGVTKKVSCMPLSYVDTEFDTSSSCIYAVVVIDARQNSSTYSAQYKVSYNNSNHKIAVEKISQMGAPKQYPNWYLKENFFPDCIKDSGHKKCHIYFDPETYKLIGPNGSQEDLFITTTTEPDGKYIFQFINTDRLAEHQLNIMIHDPDKVQDLAEAEALQKALNASSPFAGTVSIGDEVVTSEIGWEQLAEYEQQLLDTEAEYLRATNMVPK